LCGYSYILPVIPVLYPLMEGIKTALLNMKKSVLLGKKEKLYEGV
jgi:hypothetical protein